MAISSRLTSTGKILSILKGAWILGLSVVLPLGLVGQCTSNAALQGKVTEIANRNIFVSVGSDKKVILAQQLTEDQNREAFIQEFIQSAFAWTKRTSSDFQEKCKAVAKKKGDRKMFAECKSGLDKGVNIKEIGVFTSQIYAYQAVIAPESRREILAFIYKHKPNTYDQLGATKLIVDGIGKGEPFLDGKETRTPVKLTFTEYNSNNVVIGSRRVYYWIHTRNILGESQNGAQNPISEVLATTLARRMYICRILPYEGAQ